MDQNLDEIWLLDLQIVVGISSWSLDQALDWILALGFFLTIGSWYKCHAPKPTPRDDSHFTPQAQRLKVETTQTFIL